MYSVYNQDCLPGMASMEDKSIDLTLTDPPFGVAGDIPIDQVIVRLREAARVSKRLAVLMDYRNLWRVDELLHDIKIGELIWEYGWVSGGRSRAKSGFYPTHNTIGLYGDKRDFRFTNGSIIKRAPGFSSPRQCSYAKKTGHPYEKPVALMEYLLEGCSNEGELVLDPFMGSGTTGIAALRKKRRFIGYEIIGEYFKIAQYRIMDMLL